MMLLLSVLGCKSDPTMLEPATAVVEIPMARDRLRWKRFRTLQNDLAQALDLPPDAVCTELDGSACATNRRVTYVDWLVSQGMNPEQAQVECAVQQGAESCADDIWIDLYSPIGTHVVSLGGTSPFLGEQHVALSNPGLSTPMAVDRMLVSGCGERVARDSAGPAQLFEHLGLPVVEPASTEAEETVTLLYRRLLARDPTAQEIVTVAAIAGGDPAMNGAQFAQLACFTVASTSEFLFQ